MTISAMTFDDFMQVEATLALEAGDGPTTRAFLAGVAFTAITVGVIGREDHAAMQRLATAILNEAIARAGKPAAERVRA